ncbi:siderophore-interacting protein [Salinibacterium sp. ZJ450]|uniref:siderophore-interacting protein n=1 Tax=Salinibacterium sp. ZJ450 TaxID=2708338 RepID=UPI0014202A66|nr:siderophore-interacting protein [Salinibacterium sp. ZJ450]
MTTESTAGVSARERVRHPLTMRSLVVTRTLDIAPTLRRITLSGDDLHGFVSQGPEDHVKVFFPDPATGTVTLPVRDEFGRPVPGAAPVISRDYTPAEFRPGTAGDAPELDLDFVLHGDNGPASAWAARAGTGSTLIIGGPRGSQLPPTGISRLVLVADETGFPAAARWLRATPDAVDVRLILAADPDLTDTYFTTAGGNVSITVVPPRSDELEAAVRMISESDVATYVWAGAEATSLIPVRRYLRRELGLHPAALNISGYWKRGVVALDHHAPLDPEDPEN